MVMLKRLYKEIINLALVLSIILTSIVPTYASEIKESTKKYVTDIEEENGILYMRATEGKNDIINHWWGNVWGFRYQ